MNRLAGLLALWFVAFLSPAHAQFSCPNPNVAGTACSPITGNAAGSTGAVVGTLAAAAGKLTFICGFSVSALGTANTVGPITVAGLVGSSQVYQASTLATGAAQQIGQTFTPCLAASAPNTAITVTTTAAAGATAVDVNAWGYQQ